MDGKINTSFEIEDMIDNGKHNPENHKTDYNANDGELIEKYTKPQSKLQNIIIKSLYVLLHVVVVGYFAYATYHYKDVENNHCSNNENALCGIQFCNGYGMLILLVGFTYFGLFYYMIFKPKIGVRLFKHYVKPFGKWWMYYSRTRIISTVMIAVLAGALVVFLYFETGDDRRKLVSLVAPVLFILLGYIFSYNRRAIQWRTVITGIFGQFLLGVICIRWTVGRMIFECMGNKVAAFLKFTDDGSRFVFGDTIIDEGVFAFAILPVIFFFSFFISILYYLGTMQWVVMKLGWIIQQALGTTVCESVIAAANIFLGMSESPLLIRPYVKLLTTSEIHSVMVSGFATVSGTVLAAYLSFGASPAHLITSSVMAAPAALAFSKLYLPETEESKTTKDNIQLEKSEDTSLLDAASNGASNAIPLILGIIANIVAFVAFIAFLNAIVAWLGFLVGVDDINFEWLFSKLFIPLAWAMGVPWADCDKIAKVVATKTVINEFVAYQRLGEYITSNSIQARSAGIATFAICGFANPSSLGILIGALSAIAPTRRNAITKVALRAFVVGSIVCFVSASFAGIMLQEEEENKTYAKFIKSKLDLSNATMKHL